MSTRRSIPIVDLAIGAKLEALAFGDGRRSERLAANLIQAQRDYIGANSYERIDQTRGDHFHTDWTSDGGEAPADVRSTIARARSVPKSVAIMTTCAVGSVPLRVVSANRPASS